MIGVPLGGHQAHPVQHARPEQVERHRCHRVDHEGARDVEVHDANPAAGPRRPRRRSIALADEPRVPLLNAPVGIHDELGRADAGDAEDRDGRRQPRGGKLKAEATLEIRQADGVWPPKQNHRRADRQHRKQTDLDDGEAFDPLVAAAEQERQRDDKAHTDPRVDGDRRHEEVQHLRHPAIHAPDLQQRQRDRKRPGPHEPAHAGAGARHAVEPFERGVSRGNRVAAELALHHRLDCAAENDDPQHRKPDLCPEGRRGDELAGPDDRRRQHHPRPDASERARERSRRHFDRVRREDVGVGNRSGCGGHGRTILHCWLGARGSGLQALGKHLDTHAR